MANAAAKQTQFFQKSFSIQRIYKCRNNGRHIGFPTTENKFYGKRLIKKHMKKEKRNKYKLKGSIHTLEIKSNELLETGMASDYITTRINLSRTMATSRINPNKYNGDIFSFSQFKEVLKSILDETGIYKFRLTRADFRLDNYDRNHFQEFQKLNKYLVSALMVTYNSENGYQCSHLIKDSKLNAVVKNEYFECEAYDREQKNKVTGNTAEPAKSRFEERTKARQWRRLNNNSLICNEFSFNTELLKTEFTKNWKIRWVKAINNLKQVQKAYNEALLQDYREYKNVKPVRFRSLTDFLIQNQNRIFTKAQMIDLLKRLNEENPELGIANPVNREKYHKKKYGIEYFSQFDINFAIKEILRATEDFFNC
ncbi:MAG: hypothetical protein LUC92_10085 [Clostridiales bacterium]|nr:hypothetical protein [Clostridiales bacterium]